MNAETFKAARVAYRLMTGGVEAHPTSDGKPPYYGAYEPGGSKAHVLAMTTTRKLRYRRRTSQAVPAFFIHMTTDEVSGTAHTHFKVMRRDWVPNDVGYTIGAVCGRDAKPLTFSTAKSAEAYAESLRLSYRQTSDT